MSSVLPTPEETDSIEHIDSEHRMQLQLLDALCRALQSRADEATLSELLEQALTFSEMHFMTEELLMRFYSYSDYDDHVLDHDRLTEAHEALRERVKAGRLEEALEEAQHLRKYLLSHIRGRDQKLGAAYP